MKYLTAIVLSMFALCSFHSEATTTTYQYQAVIRDVETNENAQVTTEEILAYLDSVGIGINQTISGSVSLRPLIADTVPNNGLFVQADVISAGQFTLSGHAFNINDGGILTALNGPLAITGNGDYIGIGSSVSSTLPVTAGSVGFTFADLSGTAISGSDVPVFPIDLDVYSPFMLDVSDPSLTTSLLLQFRIPGNALVEFRAEFDYFTPVPLPGALLLFAGALTPLLFSFRGSH